MTLNEYQNNASKTAIYPNRGKNIIYPTLGLLGESGEIAEKVKKMIRDDNGKLTKEKKSLMIKELGDVLWYLSQLAHELDTTLDNIAQINIDKLFDRKNRNKLQGSGDTR